MATRRKLVDQDRGDEQEQREPGRIVTYIITECLGPIVVRHRLGDITVTLWNHEGRSLSFNEATSVMREIKRVERSPVP